MHARPLPRFHATTAMRSVMSPQMNPPSSFATATTATLCSLRTASWWNREDSRHWAAHV